MNKPSLRTRIANYIDPTHKNSVKSSELGKLDFFRYGGRAAMGQDWSQLFMSDQEFYTGYSYAAIKNRANQVAQLAINNLVTDAAKSVVDAAKKKDETVTHPYLPLIDTSEFSNYAFWHNISTFVDLKGIFYVLVLRNKQGSRTGNIQAFKMLNPYDVKRIRSLETGKVEGYKEWRDGKSRDIPPHMIIEIAPLNPFSRDDPYPMSQAAKDSQFALKQAGDHLRSSVRRNRNFPGAVLVGDDELALDEEQMANFKARLLGQEKNGEPIFAAGKGTLGWNDMQVDIRKSAPDMVNEVNLNNLIAVTGNSKTMFGIEQSGVTRDTANVQKDLFIANHAMPQLQLIIDALNQDFKNYYPDEYKRTQYELCIDSPLGKDREAEAKDVEIRAKSYDLFTSLVNKGYPRELAAKYANGEIPLEDLGEPDPSKAVQTPQQPQNGSGGQDDNPQPSDNQDAAQRLSASHSHDVPVIYNEFEDDDKQLVEAQQASLQNSVVNIEQKLVSAVINRVTKNQFDEQKDIINKTDREEVENELELVLAAFFVVIIPLFANTVLRRRTKEFNKLGFFSLNKRVRKYIKGISGKSAASHVDTVLNDLLATVRESALRGDSEQQIIAAIRQKYSVSISKNRAEAIARTETNRAFTTAQFEADAQFLAQNDLTAKAYKKWITRSDNPCAFCLNLAAKPPIPFETNFADLGDVLTATVELEDGSKSVRKLPINYEALEAGNAHPRCSCVYQLIIEGL